MKPINDKERTIAYFQFLVLAVLFLVLWTVAVFFDYRVKAKDYQVLKEENKRLKANMAFSSNLHLEIDSLIKVAKEMNKIPVVDFDLARKRFTDDLEILWKITPTDTTTLAKVKEAVWNVFREWSYSIQAAVNVVDKNVALKAKDEDIKELEKELKSIKEDYKTYMITHPN